MSTILRRVFPSDHLLCIAWQPKSYITQKSSKCAILIIIAVGSTWNLGIFIFKSLYWIQTQNCMNTNQPILDHTWTPVCVTCNCLIQRCRDATATVWQQALCSELWQLLRVRSFTAYDVLAVVWFYRTPSATKHTRTYNYKINKINPVAGQHCSTAKQNKE